MNVEEFELGMDFGNGYDTLGGLIRGDGVKRTDPSIVQGASGQDVVFHLITMESMQQFRGSLNISASAKATFGAFGGSAKFNYMKSVAIDSYSLYFLVSMTVFNAFSQMRDVQLKDSAIRLLRNGKPDRFREQFGDKFVRGMVLGGEFYALMRIETRSEKEKEDISAELKVSKAGLFNAEGNFAKSLEKMSRERNVLIQSLQRGGIDSADTVQHLTAEQLIKRATSFPSVAKEAPVPYAALLVDYETLDMPEVSPGQSQTKVRPTHS